MADPRRRSSWFLPLKNQTLDEIARIDAMCKPRGSRGYTYAVRPVGSKVVKIGSAFVAPADRLGDLQMMNHHQLELVGLAHGTLIERWAQSYLREHRQHGEWFLLDENPLPVTDACASCRAIYPYPPRHGDPFDFRRPEDADAQNWSRASMRLRHAWVPIEHSVPTVENRKKR